MGEARSHSRMRLERPNLFSGITLFDHKFRKFRVKNEVGTRSLSIVKVSPGAPGCLS